MFDSFAPVAMEKPRDLQQARGAIGAKRLDHHSPPPLSRQSIRGWLNAAVRNQVRSFRF
ncbi:MAG: hypothetical protein WBD92_07995 [Methylovirgula sp.]|jgi:hypothetical protein